MRRTRSVVSSTLLAAVTLSAAGESVLAHLPASEKPAISDADRRALVRGNTQFALDLYAELCGQTEENVFFAPQCISTALAMTYAGARAETAEQMRRTLHFDLDQECLHPAFADTAPMMNVTSDFSFYESQLLKAVRLPYAGDRLEMVILLPAARDGLPRLEAALTAGNLADWLGHFSTQTVDRSLPRFSTGSRFELSKTLANMGMPAAFSMATADFSGMNGRRYDLAISTVVHDAFIAIDEDGTEAAAATGVVHKRNRPRVFAADHPFVFLIRDHASGSVVFVGRIIRPGAAGA